MSNLYRLRFFLTIILLRVFNPLENIHIPVPYIRSSREDPNSTNAGIVIARKYSFREKKKNWKIRRVRPPVNNIEA